MAFLGKLKFIPKISAKDILAELFLFCAAFSSCLAAFALMKLPLWMQERFGEVSAEQVAFFLTNAIVGADPAVKASFMQSIAKEPLVLATFAVIPGLIAFLIFNICDIYRTDEDAAAQIRKPGFVKGLLFTATAAALLCGAAYPIAGKGIEPTPFYNKSPSENVMADSRFLIANAGGGINGRPYTNSLESINAAAENGFRFIELDLDLTSDGKIAAVHDWSFFKGITGNEKNSKPMSHKDFLSQKIHGSYSPADSDTINAFFENHKDIFLITDKIRDFKSILDNFSFKDRIIVEVFSYKDYDKALNMGIKYPALSLNALGKINVQAILRKNIKMATVSDVFLEQYPAEIKLLHDSGVTIMLYAPTKVINRPEYLKNILGTMASMAYVDYCSPKNTECVH